MIITAKQIEQSTGARTDRAQAFEAHINIAMRTFAIDTPVRQAAFLAQVGHESGGLRWLTELWGPTPAQERYEGRKDLGNTVEGDGFKFRGRGLIQTTGRANYTATGAALSLNLLQSPELLAQPEFAAMSAGYFWQSNGLNAIADSGDFERLTRRINGGVNGLQDRIALHTAALRVLT